LKINLTGQSRRNKVKAQYDAHVEKCDVGYIMLYFINSDTVMKYLNKLQSFTLSLFTANAKKGRAGVNI
jgi:hypothetical protein